MDPDRVLCVLKKGFFRDVLEEAFGDLELLLKDLIDLVPWYSPLKCAAEDLLL